MSDTTSPASPLAAGSSPTAFGGGSATVSLGPIQLLASSALGPALVDALQCPVARIEALLQGIGLPGSRRVASLAWSERDRLRRAVEDLWLTLRLAGPSDAQPGHSRPRGGGDPVRALLGGCLCRDQPWMLCDASAAAQQMRLDLLSGAAVGPEGQAALTRQAQQQQGRAREADPSVWWQCLGLPATRGEALGLPAEAQKLLVLLAKLWLDPICAATVWTLGQASPPWINTSLVQRLFPATGAASLALLERLAFVEVGSEPPAPDRCRLPWTGLLALLTLPAPPLPLSALRGYGVERTGAVAPAGLPWLVETLPRCLPLTRGRPALSLLLPHLPQTYVRALLSGLVAAGVYRSVTGFFVLTPPTNRPGSFEQSALRESLRHARAERLGVAVCDDGQVHLGRSPWSTLREALEQERLPFVFVQDVHGGARPRLGGRELLPWDLTPLAELVQEELRHRLARWPTQQSERRRDAATNGAVPYALRPLLEPSLALPTLAWDEQMAQRAPDAAHSARGLFAQLLTGQEGRGLATAEGLVHLPPPEHPPVLGEATLADLDQAAAYLQSYCTPGQRTLRNLLVLFSGPVGTEKSAAAVSLMAQHDLPLYRVDLASLMSRWVGETEKHIARVLDASERLGLPLLFVGANVVFGARTEVRQGSDRYGNMAVNFMLQAIDSHRGVIIALSEDIGELDAAFHRRFHCKVAFELPTEELRARLWEEELRRARMRQPARLADRLARHEPLTRSQIAFCVDRVVVRRAEGWRGKVVDQLEDTVRLMLAGYR